MAEVDGAIAAVRRHHAGVVGRSHRDRPYDADAPELAAWVHNALADSFLIAYQVYGPRRCPPEDADRYASEQVRLGARHHADPLPAAAAELSAWIAEHPDVGPSPGQREAIEFLRRPPLPIAVRVVYGFLFRAAVATLPPRIRSVLGLRAQRGARLMGRVVTALLRASLGASPSWRLALFRVDAPEPPDVRFRQPLPPGARASA
jgi:uncharacterized protein (DUF2236 family)